MLCVLFLYISGGTYSSKVDSERQTWETFHDNFINTQSFCQKSVERGNRRRNTFRILLWCLAWGSNPGFSSNKPTHTYSSTPISLFTPFCINNSNCLSDLCNADLQTTITLFANTSRLHTELIEFLLTHSPALPCLLYGKVNFLVNVFEGGHSWILLLETLLLTYTFAVLLVYFCLPVYHLFMMVFVVILKSTLVCKQVCLQHCFVFVVFVYNFDAKRSKCNTPVFRFFHYRNNILIDAIPICWTMVKKYMLSFPFLPV